WILFLRFIRNTPAAYAAVSVLRRSYESAVESGRYTGSIALADSSPLANALSAVPHLAAPPVSLAAVVSPGRGVQFRWLPWPVGLAAVVNSLAICTSFCSPGEYHNLLARNQAAEAEGLFVDRPSIRTMFFAFLISKSRRIF